MSPHGVNPQARAAEIPELTDRHYVNFAGTAIDAITFEQMFELVDFWLGDKSSRSHHIACINAYCVSLALDDPLLAAIYRFSDIAGADGMPFVYWMRLVKGLQCDRFYAPDVLNRLALRAKETGYSLYFYGGAPDVLEKMIGRLECEFPHLQIVGHHSPPFRPITEEEDRRISEEITEASPDIICVGLGTPKQDYWIDQHLDKIPGSVMVSSGATFDFYGGRIRMAPKFIQRSGFEWLYRLLGPDRKRLLRRYTLMHAKFLWNFGLQLMGLRHFDAIRRKRV